jgi:hypothetical protein
VVVKFKIEDWNKMLDKQTKTKLDREYRISYQELLDAAQIFEEDAVADNDAWMFARKFVDWKNLYDLPNSEVKRKVIGFLNKWHCRLPVSDELAEGIKDAHKQMIPFLAALENETLEDFDFQKEKEIEGKKISNEEILTKVFDCFSNIGNKFKGVAASKLLSLINPNLFVMWDTPICQAYGIRSPTEPYYRDKMYVPDFFPLMKQKGNSVILSYMEEHNCSRKEAIEGINNLKKGRPLAKLLDEYNWVKNSK